MSFDVLEWVRLDFPYICAMPETSTDWIIPPLQPNTKVQKYKLLMERWADRCARLPLPPAVQVFSVAASVKDKQHWVYDVNAA